MSTLFHKKYVVYRQMIGLSAVDDVNEQAFSGKNI